MKELKKAPQNVERCGDQTYGTDKIIRKQLDILSNCSQSCKMEDLPAITQAMLDICRYLNQPNSQLNSCRNQ